MRYSFELTIVVLWLIAILTTLFLLEDTRVFGYLAPVYFICMAGCVMTVTRARTLPKSPSG